MIHLDDYAVPSLCGMFLVLLAADLRRVTKGKPVDNDLLDSDGPDYDPEAYAEGIDLLRKARKERGGDVPRNSGDVAGGTDLGRGDHRGRSGGGPKGPLTEMPATSEQTT